MEYADIVAAAEVSNRITNRQSLKALFSRKYSPMTIVTSLIAMLQQLTGINGARRNAFWAGALNRRGAAARAPPAAAQR